MKRICLGVLVLSLAGCATVRDSRLNPLNWFGTSEPVAAAPGAPLDVPPLVPEQSQVRIVDTRALIETVDTLTIAPVSGGTLVQATGTASRLGAFNAQLVPVSFDDGVLEFAFRVDYPSTTTSTGTEFARRVDVATLLSRDEIAGVRAIRVSGATSARVSRR